MHRVGLTITVLFLLACGETPPAPEQPVCGDGQVDGDEQCDLGTERNDGAYRGCNADCTRAGYCGDGVPQDPEECDGAGESPDCDSDCTIANCGDGTPNSSAGEECDDGNTVTEACWYGEHGCTVCDAECASIPGDAAYCGDAVPNHFEGCDDGNTDDLDGCNNECTIYHDEAWSFTVPSSSTPGNSARGIAVDTNGDLLIAGVLTDLGPAYGAFVSKRGTDGTAAWQHAYALVGGANAGNIDVAAGPSGEAGFAAGGAVRLYDTAGALLWEDAYQGRDPPFTALALCATETGALLVAGFARPQGLDLDTAAFRRYEPDGAIAWTTTLWGENEVAGATGVACLPGGGFVAAGARRVLGEPNVAWVGRFDASGQAVWTQTRAGRTFDRWETLDLSGMPRSWDTVSSSASAVAADSLGNVAVVGVDRGDAYWAELIWVEKYAADGALLWSQRHELTGFTARANGVATDPADNIVVVGTEADRVWVRKYGPDGIAMWMDTYDSYPGQDAGYDVAFLADGTAFVVGDASAQPATGWLLLEYAP